MCILENDSTDDPKKGRILCRHRHPDSSTLQLCGHRQRRHPDRLRLVFQCRNRCCRPGETIVRIRPGFCRYRCSPAAACCASQMVLEQKQATLGRTNSPERIRPALRGCYQRTPHRQSQWTPLESEAPQWMQLGFKFFSVLENGATVYEAFPSASYRLLQGQTDVRINADFSACSPGPKDMLDAWVAAATVREFVGGRGAEVGGGDGLGTIILPRPLPEPVIWEVMAWPE